MTKKQLLIGLAACLAVILLIPEQAIAQARVSQFLAMKMNDKADSLTAYGARGGLRYVVCVLSYERDGDLDTDLFDGDYCDCGVVGPNGSHEFDLDDTNERSLVEIIAPTVTGRYQKGDVQDLGVQASLGAQEAVAIDNAVFEPSSADLADQTECICDAVADLGFDPDVVLRRTGYVCP